MFALDDIYDFVKGNSKLKSKMLNIVPRMLFSEKKIHFHNQQALAGH